MSIEQQVPVLMFAAVPPTVHDNRKSWISRVARSLGWRERRTKALFYCEARVVTAGEWKTLNERLNAAKKLERERAEHQHELRTSYRSVGANLPLPARTPDPLDGVATSAIPPVDLSIRAAGRSGDADAER